MSPPARLHGPAVILAGGRSSRLGEEKAAVRLGERTLLERQAAALGRLFESVGVSAAAGDRPKRVRGLLGGAAAGAGIFFDREAGQGPLEGVRAALEALPGPRAFFVAVDIPLLWAPLVRFLWREASEPGRRGAVPRHRRELEPACAVYGRELLPDIAAALARGQRSLRWLASREGVAVVDLDGPPVAEELLPQGILRIDDLFRNINTQEELAHLRLDHRMGAIPDDALAGE